MKSMARSIEPQGSDLAASVIPDTSRKPRAVAPPPNLQQQNLTRPVESDGRKVCSSFQAPRVPVNTARWEPEYMSTSAEAPPEKYNGLIFVHLRVYEC